MLHQGDNKRRKGRGHVEVIGAKVKDREERREGGKNARRRKMS